LSFYILFIKLLNYCKNSFLSGESSNLSIIDINVLICYEVSILIFLLQLIQLHNPGPKQ